MSKPLNIPESFSITENLKFEYSLEDGANMLTSSVIIQVHIPMFHGAHCPVHLVTVGSWFEQPGMAIKEALNHMMDRISTVCACIKAQYHGHFLDSHSDSHFDLAQSIRQEAKQALGSDFSDHREELIDAILAEVNANTEAA